MERSIKFRGKDINTGKWHYGSLLTWPDGKSMIYDRLLADGSMGGHEVQSDTVGQFTGLKDKKRRNIYEGDIVLSQGFRPDYQTWKKVIITWDTIGWRRFHVGGGVNSFSDWPMDTPGILEIIGNIHDNPELLKQTTD